MEGLGSRRIMCIGLTAALYVIMTVALPVLSYNEIRFRISDMLILLCLLEKDYVASTTIGCFTANLFSNVGVIDTIVGTAATFLAGVCIYMMRDKLNPISASVFPVVLNALFVGGELYFVMGKPIQYAIVGVALGEIVSVTIIGTIFYKALISNKAVMKLLTDPEKNKSGNSAQEQSRRFGN